MNKEEYLYRLPSLFTVPSEGSGENTVFNGETYDIIPGIFINADISSEIIEIPVFFYQTACKIHAKNMSIDQISLHLFKDSRNKSEHRSISYETILYALRRDIYKGLTEHIISGKLYYMGRGLILDSQFKPLLLLTYTAKKVVEPEHRLLITGCNLRISPEVLNADDIMKRHIMKVIVPKIANTEYIMGFNKSVTEISVVISDLSNWFTYTEVNYSDYAQLNHAMNDLLKEDNIIEDIIRCIHGII